MKRTLKILAFGLGMGIILVVLQEGLNIDREVFLQGYWTVALAVLVGCVLINVNYNIRYQRRMKKLAARLETGRTEDYLAGVEELLSRAKGRNLRNILRLNLAAGYLEAGQPDRALPILEELSGQRLRGRGVKLCHRLNLCTAYFYTGQYDRAMALYRASQALFAPCRNSPAYGGNVAVVDILALVQDGQYDQARQKLDAARQAWTGTRLEDAFQELEGFLAERDGEPAPEQ